MGTIFDQIIKGYNLKKGLGFYDLEKDKTCADPSHDMPTHISIPFGKGYKHVCPSCGKVSFAENTIRF